MQYKVSVIVPVYNAEKYLRECFDSLVNQTLKDIQIIAVNDGSPDYSAEICEEYEKKYDNFEYYYKENGGSASARNLGLEHATGEYIGFVDADDWVELDMYEKMYSTAKSNQDTDIVFCRVFENETAGSLDYYFPRYGFFNRQEMEKEIFPYSMPFLTEKGNYRNIRWCNWLRIHRREIIEKNHIRFFSGSRRCEDLGFTLECTIHSDSYYYLNESLYHNRPNPESKSRNYSKNMWKSIRALMSYFIEILNAYKDYDFSSELNYCVFYFCTMVIKNEVTLKDKNKSIELIHDVVSDSICKDAIQGITDEGMNDEYAALYQLMKAENASGIRKYCDKVNFKKKHIVPITNKVFQNQAVMNLYKKVRGK